MEVVRANLQKFKLFSVYLSIFMCVTYKYTKILENISGIFTSLYELFFIQLRYARFTSGKLKLILYFSISV